jgi:hypothetical protein
MLNLIKTGEARAHLYYRQLDVVNEFLSGAMFDAASDAAAAAGAGAGAGDAAAKAATDKATVDAAAGNLMDDAAKEAKATSDAENKRLLDAKDEDLNDEDKSKKAELIKKNEADAKAKVEADKAKGVPEKYVFTAPEGFNLDMEKVEKTFIPIAKELKLTQEGAQKLVDMYAGITKASIEAQAATFKTFVEGLKAETIKELGANYKQELSFAAKARDRFASPELIEKLNESGLANDKDMIKLFITIGKAVSEDKPPEGKSGAGDKKSAESILFPTAPQK